MLQKIRIAEETDFVRADWPEVLHKQRVVVHLLCVDVVVLHLRLDVLPLLLQVEVDVLVVVPLGRGASRLRSRARDGSWNCLRNPCTWLMELLPTGGGGGKDKNDQPNLHSANTVVDIGQEKKGRVRHRLFSRPRQSQRVIGQERREADVHLYTWQICCCTHHQLTGAAGGDLHVHMYTCAAQLSAFHIYACALGCSKMH